VIAISKKRSDFCIKTTTMLTTAYFNDQNDQYKELLNRYSDSNLLSSKFIAVLSKVHYCTDNYTKEDFDQFELTEVFAYLKISHQYYLNVYLPKINQTVFQLRTKFGENSIVVQLLSHFLEKYQLELETHINHEEQVLFNFVADMLNGNYSSNKKDFVLHHFLFTHNDNIIVHLNNLKQDLISLENELNSNLVFHVLFNQLEIFQNDLLIHGMIEDDIFVPKVLQYINMHFEKIARL